MGCDIHMFCEEMRTIDGVKKWVNADHWKLNPYFDPNDVDDEKYSVVELCGGRNYSMFTALCGVRDYTKASPKISDPKGLPDDCCNEIKLASDRHGRYGHSHSYCSLREVKNFVKENKPVKFSGLLNQNDAKLLDENGVLPSFWCQGSSDKTMVFRQWEDAAYQPLTGLYEAMCERFNPWRKPDEIEEKDLDNFRIVFWFDN